MVTAVTMHTYQYTLHLCGNVPIHYRISSSLLFEQTHTDTHRRTDTCTHARTLTHTHTHSSLTHSLTHSPNAIARLKPDVNEGPKLSPKPSCPRTVNAARACWAIFCGRARARPAAPLRTRAGVCTWRRPEKVWWPPATCARRGTPRCGRPTSAFRPTAKVLKTQFMESTNRGHPCNPFGLSERRGISQRPLCISYTIGSWSQFTLKTIRHQRPRFEILMYIVQEH